MLLVIVYDFNPRGAAILPHKANSPLIINSDAVLAAAIAFQCFQPVSGRHSQIVQCSRSVKIFEFAPGHILNAWRKSSRMFAAKNLFGLRTREADDH